jgi:SAM-dependent methyltransferase
MVGINIYGSDRTNLTDEDIAAGKHRKRVGGAWEEIGELQFEYLVSQGLKPDHKLLDVGCGAMRGGIRFAAYLDPGNYYGIDVNNKLLRAARRFEIPNAGLTDRMPPTNLHATARFKADGFGVMFDYALAVSVFSHLPLNHIKLCLYEVAKVMPPGGRFFTTFFYVPEDFPYDGKQKEPYHTTRAERDPFHYRPSELEWAAGVAGWEFHYLGDWKHPRGQHMAEFRRTA